MTGRLAGKRAVVSGAASGIGNATVRRFVREGAQVAMLDRDADRLGRLAEQLGDRAVPLVADVSDEPAVADAVGHAAAAFGGLDVAVANAGVQLFGEDAAADELDLAVWHATLAINLTGAFLLCKHALRSLLAAPGSSIICTASPTGLRGVAPGFDAYSASKAGIAGLIRVMAADYGPRGIRVNGVVPGFTDTPLVHDIMTDAHQRDPLIQRIPLRRAGTADEVAHAIAFLASDEASYVTGALLPVDGGILAV